MNLVCLWPTLAACTLLGMLFTATLYWLLGGHPLNRVGYAVTMSLLPAIATFLAFKLTGLRLTRRRIAAIYLLLFVAGVAVQSALRRV